MCAPAAPNIILNLEIHNESYLTMLLSIWELGEAIGPLISGPFPEMYGRLPIYHMKNVAFVVCSIACGLSNSIGMLVAFRFLNGMAVAAITLNPSIVGDLYVQEERGGMMTFMMAPTMLGMLLAPIRGGYNNQALGWRWIFWVIAIAGAIVEIGFCFLFRETYAPSMLRKMAARTHNSTLDVNDKPGRGHVYVSEVRVFKEGIIKPASLLMKEPVVMIFSLYVAVVYGETYLITTTIAPSFETYYNISEGNVGLACLGRGKSSCHMPQ